MQDQNNNSQQPAQDMQQPAGNSGQQQNVNDERDEKIKNEPDTARIRSERQSVIDGDKQGENQ